MFVYSGEAPQGLLLLGGAPPTYPRCWGFASNFVEQMEIAVPTGRNRQIQLAHDVYLIFYFVIPFALSFARSHSE